MTVAKEGFDHLSLPFRRNGLHKWGSSRRTLAASKAISIEVNWVHSSYTMPSRLSLHSLGRRDLRPGEGGLPGQDIVSYFALTCLRRHAYRRRQHFFRMESTSPLYKRPTLPLSGIKDLLMHSSSLGRSLLFPHQSKIERRTSWVSHYLESTIFRVVPWLIR